MRFTVRFLKLPIIMVLGLLSLLIEGATRLYCLVAGVAINLLLVCSVLAIVTQQWFEVVVFGILFVAMLLVLLCVGMVAVVIDNLRSKLKDV